MIVQAEVIPTCRELGIAIVPYSPLGRGFLTGNIRSLKNLHESDVRFKVSPRFQGENLEKVGLGLEPAWTVLLQHLYLMCASCHCYKSYWALGMHMLYCTDHVCAVIRAVSMIGIRT